MSTNQTHSTQRTTPDPLKSTREKLARKIKTALKTTSPEETLQIWMLITADKLRERANTWDLSKLEWNQRIPLDAALESLEGIPFQNPYYWAAFILTGC